MPTSGDDRTRPVILSADRDSLPVVFEMLGHVVLVEPFESLRLLVRGAPDAELTIGYGPNGVSVFRDEALEVEIYNHKGSRLKIPGW